MQNYESESLEVLKKRGYSKEEAIKIVEKDQSIRKSNRSAFFIEGFKKNLVGFHVGQLFELKHGYNSVDEAIQSVKNNDETYVVELKNGLEQEVSNQVDLFRFMFDLNTTVFKDAQWKINAFQGSLGGLKSFSVAFQNKDKSVDFLAVSVKDGAIKLQDKRKNIKKEDIKDTFSSGAELKEYLTKTKAS
jgi:hypothetical protein